MPASSYAELQSSIADWLNRSDLENRIPDFISLGETRLSRELHLGQLETRAQTTTVSGQAYISRPTDSNGIRSIRLMTSPVQNLQFEPSETIDMRYMGSTNGKPIAYTIEGDNIRLAPTPDSEYTLEISYEQKPAQLSSANTTNWYTDNAPDLLLFASLIEASPFIRDMEMVMYWVQAYEKAKREMQKRDNKIKYPAGSTLQIRAN
jgi:hypothetical protein